MRALIIAALVAATGIVALPTYGEAEARCGGANGYCTRAARRRRQAAAVRAAAEAERYAAWYAGLAPIEKAREDLRKARVEIALGRANEERLRQDMDAQRVDLATEGERVNWWRGFWVVVSITLAVIAATLVVALADTKDKLAKSRPRGGEFW